ncbi:hypothetical protein [Thaumasiovibrio sp. DFM-14]|uniref:hypothetical protein n=1 Tax=Thaumasiovibrio sp. DFM-14 TaxID=3384792 RepID=UPI0039A2C449
MKKSVLVIALGLLLPLSSHAMYGVDAGVYLGSPSSGLTIKAHPHYKFSVGLDTFSVSADAMLPLDRLIKAHQLDLLYGYTGLQYVDDKRYQFGARFGLGLELPLGNSDLVSFYAEAGPHYYFSKESAFRLEGQAGMRFKF